MSEANDVKEASFQTYQPETIKALLQPMQSGARQTVCAWKALPAANGRAASGRAAKPAVRPLYIATLQSKPTKQQASTAAEVCHHMKYIIKALLHPMHTVHAHD